MTFRGLFAAALCIAGTALAAQAPAMPSPAAQPGASSPTTGRLELARKYLDLMQDFQKNGVSLTRPPVFSSSIEADSIQILDPVSGLVLGPDLKGFFPWKPIPSGYLPYVSTQDLLWKALRIITSASGFLTSHSTRRLGPRHLGIPRTSPSIAGSSDRV